MQITELNRQLKAASEANLKQQRLLSRKTKELQASQKTIEKLTKLKQDAGPPQAESEQRFAKDDEASDEEAQPVTVTIQNAASKPNKALPAKKQQRRKLPAKTPPLLKSPYTHKLRVQKQKKEAESLTKLAKEAARPQKKQAAPDRDGSKSARSAERSVHSVHSVRTDRDVVSEAEDAQRMLRDADADEMNRSLGDSTLGDQAQQEVAAEDADLADNNDEMDDEVERQFSERLQSAGVAAQHEDESLVEEDARAGDKTEEEADVSERADGSEAAAEQLESRDLPNESQEEVSPKRQAEIGQESIASSNQAQEQIEESKDAPAAPSLAAAAAPADHRSASQADVGVPSADEHNSPTERASESKEPDAAAASQDSAGKREQERLESKASPALDSLRSCNEHERAKEADGFSKDNEAQSDKSQAQPQKASEQNSEHPEAESQGEASKANNEQVEHSPAAAIDRDSLSGEAGNDRSRERSQSPNMLLNIDSEKGPLEG